jgi:hypothetical protein
MEFPAEYASRHPARGLNRPKAVIALFRDYFEIPRLLMSGRPNSATERLAGIIYFTLSGIKHEK